MHPASSMARFGAGAAFQALSVRPVAAPFLPARSGKVIAPKRCFIVSSRLAWMDDELMEIEKSEEESPVKLKKRPPLRRGKIYPQLSVPEHIPRPSYVGSKGLPELCSVRQIHDAEGIAGMRAACKLAARVLDFAGNLVKPSVTTNEIDKAVHNMIIEAGAYPSPLGYCGFPKSNGDIINIDVNVFLNGYHGGTSRTFVCGKVDDSINHFLKVSYFFY
ncbi:hypothetical protein PR202_gb20926 [Eleusine coracana subsp. coracana]|uniref:Methionine aminopeptidase n=1 Tax=Eleusine coracana subsp. coracana TaxID=191504 RepID=A0AAV5FBQ2_ELECO|nr:hypothetical protein PR202_gb20926 [Eleusine coracana subsp. coracana]